MPATLKATEGTAGEEDAGRRVKPRTKHEGGSKDKRLKGIGDKGLRRLLLVMVKQLLRYSQGMRELDECLFDTSLCPAGGFEATKIPEQTHNYSTAAKKDGKGHPHGAPYIWALAGLIEALKERGSEVGDTSAKSVMEIWGWPGPHNMEENMEMIRMCCL
ncbi:unnamed protein product [Prorocentrum cordatum]|uniref:Uncharacterized protein n=1 Tax=Prorocentrum cordatum TaxID=2364126 RepID=A0ABN9RQ84_9DINO|nr:unnamed protein product [Polarella glacialis]